MKKILTILVVSIFILIGFNAIAIPQEKHIEKNPLYIQGFSLEIVIEGGFLGYSITITNTGPEQVRGNLSIEITTDAMVILFGETLSKEVFLDLNPITGIDSFKLQPLIGFGSSSIIISGVFDNEIKVYPFETISNGYSFIIYLICDKASITIP